MNSLKKSRLRPQISLKQRTIIAGTIGKRSKEMLPLRTEELENPKYIKRRNVKLLESACTFASYIKNRERGKKDRGAIASGNMIKIIPTCSRRFPFKVRETA